MPEISIIIPVFNSETYLKRCLDSICFQTLEDIEIICIDDCSNDNSAEILKSYSKKDERIKIFTFKQKQNAAIARNKGLEIANSRYIAFVDSDDAIDCDFLEKLHKKAQISKADIIKGEVKDIYPDGKIIKTNSNHLIKERNNKMLFCVYWFSAIYKKEMIDNNSIIFPCCCPKGQDLVFLTKSLISAKSIEICENAYYNYFRRKDSLSAAKLSDENFLSALKSYDLTIDELNASSNLLIENEYAYAYSNALEGITITLFKTDNIQLKLNGAHKLINAYNLCKTPKKTLDFFSYCLIVDYLKNEKPNEIIKKLEEFKTWEKFRLKNIMLKLKSSISMEKCRG